MADKAILSTLPKLNGSNWFEWKKEAETFLLLAGLDGIIDAEDIPTGTKAAEWTVKDRKTYAYLFFLIEPNYRAPIIEIKSRREAWKKLVAEYEKDSATTRMALCQQFYSLTHDPAVGIAVFIDAVFSIVVSSVNCFHNIYHRGSRFTQLPTYLFSVVRLARGAIASFD
jgi:gag-polypeptide of LTR copia-type